MKNSPSARAQSLSPLEFANAVVRIGRVPLDNEGCADQQELHRLKKEELILVTTHQQTQDLILQVSDLLFADKPRIKVLISRGENFRNRLSGLRKILADSLVHKKPDPKALAKLEKLLPSLKEVMEKHGYYTILESAQKKGKAKKKRHRTHILTEFIPLEEAWNHFIAEAESTVELISRTARAKRKSRKSEVITSKLDSAVSELFALFPVDTKKRTISRVLAWYFIVSGIRHPDEEQLIDTIRDAYRRSMLKIGRKSPTASGQLQAQ